MTSPLVPASPPPVVSPGSCGPVRPANGLPPIGGKSGIIHPRIPAAANIQDAAPKQNSPTEQNGTDSIGAIFLFNHNIFDHSHSFV